MKNNKGPLHKRKERIFFLYKNYLLDDRLEDIDSDLYSFNGDQKQFIEEIIDNFVRLESKIIEFIPSDWDWSRFNTLEKAIILNGAAEILIAENTKAISIDESIEFARKYCGEKSQPLINGILDKLEIKDKKESN